MERRDAPFTTASMISVLLALVAPALASTEVGCVSNATVLFRDGMVDSRNRTWACVRGAAVVRAPSPSAAGAVAPLLAFSGGSHTCADGGVGWAIFLRRSVDNGETWTRTQTVVYDANETGGYIAPLVDAQASAVILLYQRRFVETWTVRSVDGGCTWGRPANWTATVGGPLALGPPGGVQLPSGRLVQPAHAAGGTFALLSDDGGKTWRRGQTVPFPAGVVSGGEAQAVAVPGLGPAALAMTIRVATRDVEVNHAVALSSDGGDSWAAAAPAPFARGPTCQGSIALGGGPGHLRLSAPHWPHWRYPADRRNLTVWEFSAANTSAPPLRAWRVWPGPAAYSSLLPDGTAVLFEGGDAFRYASILFARILC